MVSFNLGEGDSTSFVEGLQTEGITLVEVTLSEWQKSHVLVIGLEPFTLLWPDHGIFAEHHQEKSIQAREFSLLDGLSG